MLVHLDSSELPLDYALVTIDIPDRVPMKRATPAETLAASTNPAVPVYVVPSVVVPQELNVVIFPHAPGFESMVISVEPFQIDERLIGLEKRP